MITLKIMSAGHVERPVNQVIQHGSNGPTWLTFSLGVSISSLAGEAVYGVHVLGHWQGPRLTTLWDIDDLISGDMTTHSRCKTSSLAFITNRQDGYLSDIIRQINLLA